MFKSSHSKLILLGFNYFSWARLNNRSFCLLCKIHLFALHLMDCRISKDMAWGLPAQERIIYFNWRLAFFFFSLMNWLKQNWNICLDFHTDLAYLVEEADVCFLVSEKNYSCLSMCVCYRFFFLIYKRGAQSVVQTALELFPCYIQNSTEPQLLSLTAPIQPAQQSINPWYP